MAVINQKEYLKKYLSIGSEPGKKKKKKKKVSKIIKSDRLKIVDDDDDVRTFTQTVTEDLMGEEEDAPQIVGIVDDRPLELKLEDYKKSGLWKPAITNDNDVLVLSNENASSVRPMLKVEKFEEDESTSTALPTDIKQEVLSPPTSPNRSDVDPDDSPPRRRRTRRSDSEDDQSRPRRKDHPLGSGNRDLTPPRKQAKHNEKDSSPPRKSSKSKEKLSFSLNINKIIKKEKSASPERHTGDLSPPRRRIKQEDLSPPRKQKRWNESSQRNKQFSPPRRSRLSPSRQIRQDMSPPRRSRHSEDNSPPRRRRKSDSSPPRRRREHKSPNTEQRNETASKKSRWDNESSDKMTKTLDGKKAGLQNAQELVKENEAFKRREDELFNKMSSEVSGINAQAVLRDRKTGKKRNLEEEAKQLEEKQRKQAENKEKYDRWGKGVKQVEDYNAKLQADLHEMNKPLARYADDEDLEKYLKEQEREGDPMLAYLRKKKKKDRVKEGKPTKPEYEGEFMPNRFGIKPGHRWDGVNRSNGYEQKWFEVQNAKKASQEEVYKWSTEDM